MNLFNYISDLFFPPQCIFCEKSLPLAHRPMICGDCGETLISDEIRCPKCDGIVLPDSNLLPVCDTCRIAGRYYDGAVFVFDYHDKVRDAICRFKLSRQLYAGSQLAQILAKRIRDAGISRFNTDVVINVPSDRRRNISRGFDSGGFIAAEVAKNLHIHHAQKTVVRIKDIERQSSLSYSKRQENVRGAFKVSNPDFVRGKKILLVDDVITTGATVTEISRVLRRAGAAYIFVAAVARTTKRIGNSEND